MIWRESILQTTKVKLKDIAEIFTGLPVQRYIDKENCKSQKIISNISLEDMDQDFEFDDECISIDKEQFFSQEHDILVKVQQQIFAKEITTETDAIIPNTYVIIRVDKDQVNSTYLTHYLNNPIVNYEILRQVDSTRIIKINISILKDLTILLPEKEVQDYYANLITKINSRIIIKKKSMESDEKLVHALLDDVIGDYYDH